MDSTSKWSPLGSFKVDAPLHADALSQAKWLITKLPYVPVGNLTRLYYHWTAETWGCVDGAYHVVVDHENGQWKLKPSHSPLDNAENTFSDNYAEHTMARNESGVAIAINGLDGTSVGPHNFGADPITYLELEYLCAGGAALAKVYGIDVSGMSGPGPQGCWGGETNLLTHAEAANKSGNPWRYAPYGPLPEGDMERWDLASFVQLPTEVAVTSTYAKLCGDALRARTHLYKLSL